MSEPTRILKNPPVIEVVLDIDCDLSPTLEMTSLEERARDLFRENYPELQTRFLFEHQFEFTEDPPPRTSSRRAIDGYMLWSADRKQLIQIRSKGYSFNRLAPYTTLVDYLSEIRRTWELYLKLATPLEIQIVRLRYINKFSVPYTGDATELGSYLTVAPIVSDNQSLEFRGFLNQQLAAERETKNEVKIITSTQEPTSNSLPIVFDITAANSGIVNPKDWDSIVLKVQSLRDLNNRVFDAGITPKCLQLFQ